MSQSQRNFMCSGLLLLGIVGCSTASAALEKHRVEVSGTVIIDGKPAEGVMVVLVPAGGNVDARQGLGVTDSDGQFTVENFQQNSGMPPGEYTALLTLWLTPEGELPPPDVPPANARARQAIPATWHNPAMAGKHNSVVVDKENGAKDLVFKLQTNGNEAQRMMR